LRGVTAVAVLADEAAFWSADGSANPDTEILNAVRPSLATTSGPLIVISSPHARRGEVWQTYKRAFGELGDPKILVLKGPSRALNPTLPQAVVDRAMERDPASASAEYLAEFRVDLEPFVSREIAEAAVDLGVFERPPMTGTMYFGFTDPSGGSMDSMTAAIAHSEGRLLVLDAVREFRPHFRRKPSLPRSRRCSNGTTYRSQLGTDTLASGRERLLRGMASPTERLNVRAQICIKNSCLS
jgi:hypothetical protein